MGSRVNQNMLIVKTIYNQHNPNPPTRSSPLFPPLTNTDYLLFGFSERWKMMIRETTKVGKRGTIVISAALRRQYGFEEGSQVAVEPVDGGILLRPAVTIPVEIYTPKRKAEFLLNNAITLKDYAFAVDQVRKLGLDPEKIPHKKPASE